MASAGIPLLLRWFPDPGSVPSDTSKCLGKAGATGYVQAYREIVRQFRLAGAGNVGFVWSVDTNSPQSPATPWSAYYPGGGFVDWIGADGYDESSSPATVDSIKTQFRAWYSEFAPSGKPLMISDTGAIAAPEPLPAGHVPDAPRDGAAIGVSLWSRRSSMTTPPPRCLRPGPSTTSH